MISYFNLGRLGQFGNMLFQYATLRSVAIKNNYICRVPESAIQYLNQYFNSMESFPLTNEDNGMIKYKYKEKIGDSGKFDPNIFNILDNTDIEGYFQSEKYFINIEEQIKREFSFKLGIELQVDGIKQNIQNCYQGRELVSVHFRRGDYLTTPDDSGSFLKGLKYFSYAKEKLYSMKDEDKLVYLIFSDDIEWCRENVKPMGEEKIMVMENMKDFIYEFILMSKCEHNIISNSSFSWWSAWLNNNPNKIVIAPQDWFGISGREQTKDIIPEKWHIVESY